MTDHVALLLVARIHDGRVLVDETGTLPSFAHVEGESALSTVLRGVEADLLLAPVTKLADGRLVFVVGSRGPAPEDGFLPPSTLIDPELAALVNRAVVEQDPAHTPALRPPWYRADWFDRVEQRVDALLAGSGTRRTAPVAATKLWSISAVLRVPTDRGDLWLKAPCEHFRAETRVHLTVARLLPDLVPELVAVDEDQGWLLMRAMRGVDDDRLDGAGSEVATRWADAQIDAVAHVPELLGGGCPRRGVDETLSAFREVLAGSTELALLDAEELAAVRGCAEEIEALAREFWAAGIPDTLAHGDLHLGNVAWDGHDLRIFDWTDGCVSHPFLDASHLAHFGEDQPDESGLELAYAERWRSAYPDADIDRALALAPLVDLVFQAVTFEGIVSTTEPQSRWELGGVVADILRSLPAKVTALGSADSA